MSFPSQVTLPQSARYAALALHRNKADECDLTCDEIEGMVMTRSLMRLLLDSGGLVKT
jgi:hypothetical protein